MNELQIFENSDFGSVRTITIDNEPWFVASDIAKALGYRMASDLTRRIDEEDKGTHSVSTPSGMQNMTVVNESGLYEAILGSKIPNAKKFKKWVTSEVLPSIRKHGMYAVDDLINNPELAIKAFTALKEEREKNTRLTTEINIKNQIIGELKPKADYTDKILKSKDLVTITQIAKDYGMSGTEMNKLLNELRIQYKQSGQWLLYADYQSKGYTMSETVPITYSDGTSGTKANTKWTQKGRLFLYEELKKHDIYPMIEKSA